MVCPHSGESFQPQFIQTATGHLVAAPIQVSPQNENKQMVSAYGSASGIVEPNELIPLARNTSSKFDLGRNFANKLWNATRFALNRISAEPVENVDLANRPFIDKWIFARLDETTQELRGINFKVPIQYIRRLALRFRLARRLRSLFRSC